MLLLLSHIHLLLYVRKRVESTYVRRMIVELQVVIDDGVVDVVCPDQMLERPRSLLGRLFNLVNLDRGNVHALSRRAKPRRQTRKAKAKRSQ